MILALLTALLCQKSPSEELKRIEWVIGSWAGKGSMGGMEYEDEYVLEWTADGNFIRNEYVMKVGGKVVWTDTGLLGWDPAKKKVVGINFGQDGTIGWGHEQESGQDELVVEGRTAGPSVNEEFRAKLKKVDADHLSVTMEMKQGGKFVAQPAVTYTRKKFTLTAAPEEEKFRLHYENLKALEFLVGSWRGTGESAQGVFEVEYEFAWALNRNFLVKKVVATAMNQVVWSATEWIGWDVDEKKIVAIGFGRDGSITVGHASEATEKALEIAGADFRSAVRLEDGKLANVIEKKRDGTFVEDKKITVAPDPMKPLEWLVGAWESGDEQVVYEWAMGRSFLKATAVYRSGGKVVWFDTGYFGWDRDQKKFSTFRLGIDGSIGWGKVTPERGQWVVEGRLVGPNPVDAFRFTVRRVDADTYSTQYGSDARTYKRISKAEIPDVPDAPKLQTATEKVRPYEWIVGSWASAGESPDLGKYEDAYTFAWSLNRNFLKIEYEVKVGGQVAWADTSYVGWDPQKKKLVQLTFGNDGTIGWGEQVESKDELVFEGATTAPGPFKHYRFTLRKADGGKFRGAIEFKRDGKWATYVDAVYEKR